MDSTVARLSTPEECEQFIINVRDEHPELAIEARRRAIELRALRTETKTDAEREAIAAVYAYEAVLAERKGKHVRAQRTWNMIERHGIIGAVERAVDRAVDTVGYQALAAMKMTDLSFEAVVVRHPSVFTSDAVTRCKERLATYAEQQVSESKN